MRPSIPEIVKLAVIKRDGIQCHYCGITAKSRSEVHPKSTYPWIRHFDHVQPLSRGGSNTVDNLVVSCVYCNRQKGIKTIEEWREKLSFMQPDGVYYVHDFDFEIMRYDRRAAWFHKNVHHDPLKDYSSVIG